MVAATARCLLRHSEAFPWPVCGGWATLPRGKGIRCAGMEGDSLIWCTRPEHAGNAPLGPSNPAGAYRHQRFGWCPCGTEHGHRLPFPHFDLLPQQLVVAANDVLDAALRHEIYSALVAGLELRGDARADLMGRGLTDNDIVRVGYRSVPATLAERRQLLRGLESPP